MLMTEDKYFYYLADCKDYKLNTTRQISIDYGGIGPENVSLFKGETTLAFSLVLMIFNLLDICFFWFVKVYCLSCAVF